MSDNYWETRYGGWEFLRCGKCHQVKLVSYEEGQEQPSLEELGLVPTDMCRCGQRG